MFPITVRRYLFQSLPFLLCGILLFATLNLKNYVKQVTTDRKRVYSNKTFDSNTYFVDATVDARLAVLVNKTEKPTTQIPDNMFHTVEDIHQFQKTQQQFKPEKGILSLAAKRYIINCTNIHEIKLGPLLGHGYHKSTYAGTFRGIKVAVKVLSQKDPATYNCVDRISKALKLGSLTNIEDALYYTHCKSSAESMFHEILNHAVLDYPNIVRSIGHCLKAYDIENDTTDVLSQGIVSVFEYGDPFSFESFQARPWYERIRYCRDLANLLDLFENSLLGSIVYRDFHMRHFVVAEGKIKLIDMDNWVTSAEQRCGPPEDIPIEEKRKVRYKNSYNYNCSFGIHCAGGLCTGGNAIENMHIFTDTFFRKLLGKHTLPTVVLDNEKEFIDNLHSYKMSPVDIVRGLDRILDGTDTNVDNNLDNH